LKRYVFCYDNYPLGQLQFNEVENECEFTYCYTSYAPDHVKVRPETVITFLEGIRCDAKEIKTIDEFETYVRSNFGKFHYFPLKGYE